LVVVVEVEEGGGELEERWRHLTQQLRVLPNLLTNELRTILSCYSHYSPKEYVPLPHLDEALLNLDLGGDEE